MCVLVCGTYFVMTSSLIGKMSTSIGRTTSYLTSMKSFLNHVRKPSSARGGCIGMWATSFDIDAWKPEIDTRKCFPDQIGWMTICSKKLPMKGTTTLTCLSNKLGHVHNRGAIKPTTWVVVGRLQ